MLISHAKWLGIIQKIYNSDVDLANAYFVIPILFAIYCMYVQSHLEFSVYLCHMNTVSY
jgi:hypothetical protein